MIRRYSLSGGGSVRLFQHADGRLTFADKDPAKERAALRGLVLRRRQAWELNEAIHAAHMRLFAPKFYDEPERPTTREAVHEIRDDEEERSWQA